MSIDDIKNVSLEDRFTSITALIEKIKEANSWPEKLATLNSQDSVKLFLACSGGLKSILSALKPEHEFIVKILIALGQGPLFFVGIDRFEDKFEALHSLLDQLLEVESSYSFMGGLAGYYCKVIALIIERQKNIPVGFQNEKYDHPTSVNGSTDLNTNFSTIRCGIESLPLLAHICPIGGAGDRLNLIDENTGTSLPVAFLEFGGFSLLEGIVRDLQGIEFLYWKLFQRQLIAPIALMTSEEKNNDAQIQTLCEKNDYFGRGAKNFRRFIQPLVPVITEDGDFALSSPLKLILKPGGHGVIWNLAVENNIFSWFESLGREKLFIRQINNPVAGSDGGICSFIGAGIHYQKSFGFLSCDRLIGAAEGMLAIREKHMAQHFYYSLTNIEYTEIATRGFEDAPKKEGSSFSAYPANTNILFGDIKAIKSVISKDLVPGMTINMKTKFNHIDRHGQIRQSYGGRLESMMQNIADSFVYESTQSVENEIETHLPCYVVYGERRKVISVTKKQFFSGKSILETPEGCFYDKTFNGYELLTKHCRMILPEMNSQEEFIYQGPPFILHYHPALGPLYQVTAQKVQGGVMSVGSELQLEIAELNMQNLHLDGSLSIVAKNTLGHKDPDGTICYSNLNGKCELKNVTIVNQGIDRNAKNNYWKNVINRKEQLEIVLHGNAEFFASDVGLEGAMRFEVPAGKRMEVTMKEGKIHSCLFDISAPTWQWHYAFDAENVIKLKLY